MFWPCKVLSAKHSISVILYSFAFQSGIHVEELCGGTKQCFQVCSHVASFPGPRQNSDLGTRLVHKTKLPHFETIFNQLRHILTSITCKPNWQKQHSCSVWWLTCHFCQKWDDKPKLAETTLLVSNSTPRIHSEASPLAVTCCGGRLACIASFPGLLHLQFLIVYSMQKRP